MGGDSHPFMRHPWTRVQMSCHILDMAASWTILFRCFSASGLRNLREIRGDHMLRDNFRSLPLVFGHWLCTASGRSTNFMLPGS